MKNSGIVCSAIALSVAIGSFVPTDAETSPTVIRQESPLTSLFELHPDEGFRLEFLAPPGEFGVDYSNDLQTWEPLATVTAVDGRGVLTDPEALSSPRGFYRVNGTFTAADYHIIDPGYGIEYNAPGVSGSFADLWLLLGDQAFTLQSASEDDGQIIRNGEALQVRSRVTPNSQQAGVSRMWSIVERENPGLGAYDPSAFEFQPEALVVDVPEPDAPLRFISLEGDRDFLVGRSVETFTRGQRAGVNVSRPFLARKSVNADPAMLEGEWGFIVFRVEAEGSGFQDIGYQLSVFAGGIDSTGLTAFQDELHLSAHQPVSGAAIDYDMGSGSLNNGRFTVEADGSVEFGPEEATDSFFQGYASPSGNMMVIVSSRPSRQSLSDGADSVEDDQPEVVDQAYVMGVKRDASLALAGNTYRIHRHGFWIEAGRFEIDASPEFLEETLVFSADGSSATRTAYFESYWTSFSGIPGEQHYGSGEIDYDSISIRPDAMIVMDGLLEEESSSASLFGFSHDNGRVLILADGIEDDGEGLNMGLIIAVRQD